MSKHKHVSEDVVFEGSIAVGEIKLKGLQSDVGIRQSGGKVQLRNEGKEWTDFYYEGTFVPVPTNLTVVGAATIQGFYRVVGHICFYEIDIYPDGESDTSQSTAGTTCFTLPPPAAIYDGSCLAGETGWGSSFKSFGGGIQGFAGESEVVFPPSWAATSHHVQISGWYFFD
jgi:hypothetical protein